MSAKSVPCILLISLFLTLNCEEKPEQAVYSPTWTCLRKHDTPDWLEDAKFGIYCHWGLRTVTYLKGMPESQLEVIPQFKAEKFDPAEWAELFKAAGAQFAGPVSWHGSKFVHWDSDVTKWNSMDMGPGIDIVGSLATEIKNRNMKFVMSYHSAHFDNWLEIAKEGVTQYQPDLVYVDAGFGGTKRAHGQGVCKNGKLVNPDRNDIGGLPENVQQMFLAYYFNKAIEWNKQVEFLYKTHDVPPGIAMRDYENGILDELAYDPWIVDLDMNIQKDYSGTWFYKEGVPFKSANHIIDILVDVVSKNGRLMLNVPPKADGTFPEEVRETLLQIGEWLEVNGEAIYGTMPWVLYGEGPTDLGRSGHHSDHFGDTKFTAKDIRFTTRNDTLYAICLGWPGEKINMRLLGSRAKLFENELERVELVGLNEQLQWKHTPDALTVYLPETKSGDFAFAFRILRK